MRLICDRQARQSIIDQLHIPVKQEQTVMLGGLCPVCTAYVFYFQRQSAAAQAEYLLLEMEDEAIWALDKQLSPIALAKEFVKIEDGMLVPIGEQDERECFIYVRREDDSYVPQIAAPPYGTPMQLSTCDLYLMIPGKLSKQKGAWERLPTIHSSVFNTFQKDIDKVVAEEYHSDFARSLERKCLAQVELEILKAEEVCYRQGALVGIVKHDTDFCILEIIIQNCAIGGNKILNYYCGDLLQIRHMGRSYTLDAFCQLLQIRRFGRKRSMVFAFGDVPEQEIVNALANEETPMGTIGGDFLRKVQTDNIAQYDTAQVYVSHETMFEKCKDMDIDGDCRLSYNGIEMFFVELILFQDAAIDKVYVDLHAESQRQHQHADPYQGMERLEQFSFDMEKAIRFSDYDQFNFPSVRKSAMKVSERFGVRYIYEKYETNKQLLSSMIATNKRRIQEKQDKVKNHFLLLLSAMAAVGTLGEILYVIHEDHFYGAMSYAVALGVIAGMFGIYKLVEWIAKKVYSRIMKKKN